MEHFLADIKQCNCSQDTSSRKLLGKMVLKVNRGLCYLGRDGGGKLEILCWKTIIMTHHSYTRKYLKVNVNSKCIPFSFLKAHS